MDRYVNEVGDLNEVKMKRMKKGLKTAVKDEVSAHQEMCNREGQDAAPPSRWRLSFNLARTVLTGILLPILDIGTDLFAAATHFYWNDFSWGFLTLFFVGLPGLVCGLAVAIMGLRKSFSFRRLANFTLLVLVGPVAYPLVQIIASLYMAYMMLLRKDLVPLKLMRYDVKQFNSLEGFLESGPQFVLQAHILLRGEKRGVTDLREEDAKRLGVILLSIILSMASLVNTSVKVNQPDPDERRRSRQCPENTPLFLLTSFLFNGLCVVFRLSSIALSFATLRYWANAVLAGVFLLNVLTLHLVSSNHVATLLLGALSIFVPNGYLLYNFAATFIVDFTFRQTRTFLFAHVAVVTPIFLAINAVIMGLYQRSSGLVYSNTQIAHTVLNSEPIFYAIAGTIEALGALSLAFFVWHWEKSIRPLYGEDQDQTEQSSAV